MQLNLYQKIILYSLIGFFLLGGLLFYLLYFTCPSLHSLAQNIYDQKLDFEAAKEQSKIENNFTEEINNSFPLLADIQDALLDENSLVKFLERIENNAKKYSLGQKLTLKREEVKKPASSQNSDSQKDSQEQNNQSSNNDKKEDQNKKTIETDFVDLEITLEGEFQNLMSYLADFEKLESLPNVIYYEWQRQEEISPEDKNIIILPELKLLIKVKLFAPKVEQK